MSLSDYIKFQRALKGGLTPWEIAEASGVPARDVHLMEVKHRRMGEDDATLVQLASYFGVPLQDLTARREAYRKRLTYFLEDCRREPVAMDLQLESGEVVSGSVVWYSREAIALQSGEQEADVVVVQRPWIADWRCNGTPDWEVSASAATSKSAG
ncbi:MAG: hypothetical protein ABI670_15120 [Chloroflexota bacterium]